VTGVPRPARDPFAVLGLSADGDLTDDDVRIAWRRVAAATHPDRADGGDPDRFARAAAAYTELRTGFGRNEARAELARGARVGPRLPFTLSPRHARPASLLLRLAVATAVAVLGGTAAGWNTPAAPALVAGALTWFLVTARRSMSMRPGPGRTATATTSRLYRLRVARQHDQADDAASDKVSVYHDAPDPDEPAV
jgi:hypothetical protein